MSYQYSQSSRSGEWQRYSPPSGYSYSRSPRTSRSPSAARSQYSEGSDIGSLPPEEMLPPGETIEDYSPFRRGAPFRKTLTRAWTAPIQDDLRTRRAAGYHTFIADTSQARSSKAHILPKREMDKFLLQQSMPTPEHGPSSPQPRHGHTVGWAGASAAFGPYFTWNSG